MTSAAFHRVGIWTDFYDVFTGSIATSAGTHDDLAVDDRRG